VFEGSLGALVFSGRCPVDVRYLLIEDSRCFRPYFPSIREGAGFKILLSWELQKLVTIPWPAASLWVIEVWGFQDWNTGRGPQVTCYHGVFEDSYGGGKT